MKPKLLVVADLGRLKAYKLDESRFNTPRLELIDDQETGVTRHLSAEVTDQAGQFRKGPANAEGSGGLSDGEQHNLDLERRRRAVKNLAQNISRLLENQALDGCYLAADSRINQLIVNEMPERSRARIEKTVCANLSKLTPAEIINHFRE